MRYLIALLLCIGLCGCGQKPVLYEAFVYSRTLRMGLFKNAEWVEWERVKIIEEHNNLALAKWKSGRSSWVDKTYNFKEVK